MATISIFIVCFFIKAPFVIGNIYYRSKEYNIINELDFNKPKNLIPTNSMGKPLSFPLQEFPGAHLRNMEEHEFFPSPTNAVQNTMPFHSGPTITNIPAFSSPKRQRRWVTFPPSRHPRRQSITTGSDGSRLQAFANSRQRIMADDHFWRSQNVAGLNQNGRHTWQRIPGFPNHERRFISFSSPRIINPEFMMRPSGMRSNSGHSGSLNNFRPNKGPEINGHILNPGQSRSLNSFQTNKESEMNRSIRNTESEERGGIHSKRNQRGPNTESDSVWLKSKLPDIKSEQKPQRIPSATSKPPFLQAGDMFSKEPQLSLKRNMRVQFPELDWSGPVPWPRQGQRQMIRQTQYPLFPWWQKRTWTPRDRSDQQPNFEETEHQPDTEDAWNVATPNRGDVDVPDPCIALTAKGDCNFYRCFDQQHTCPLEQNFAYNVASHMCRRTENYMNFFDDKARKYLRDVKRCQMEALVPTYTSEVVTCAQIEAIGLDILTGGILPPSVNDVSCFFQNMTFCDVMENPQNVQLMYDLYGGNGYTEYRVFIHFVKLIQKCSVVAMESFNERYAYRFMTFDD